MCEIFKSTITCSSFNTDASKLELRENCGLSCFLVSAVVMCWLFFFVSSVDVVYEFLC